MRRRISAPDREGVRGVVRAGWWMMIDISGGMGPARLSACSPGRGFVEPHGGPLRASAVRNTVAAGSGVSIIQSDFRSPVIPPRLSETVMPRTVR